MVNIVVTFARLRAGIGMGYVGIPCAALLADVPSFQVTGVRRRSLRQAQDRFHDYADSRCGLWKHDLPCQSVSNR